MEYFNNLINSLSSTVGEVLPRILGALAVLILGFIVAGVVRRLVKGLLSKTSIDEKIGKRVKSKVRVDDFVAKLCYYIVVLFALLVVLDLLGADGALAPLEGMVADFVAFFPLIVVAGVIGYAGYMIATIASEATGFITQRVENFTESKGIDTGSISIAQIIKQIVFIFVFIPILIVALDTLKMDAISQPATEMLQSFMGAIPKVIAAAILLAVFYVVGKYLISIGVELLKSLGLDNLSEELGIAKMTGKKSLSQIVGSIGLFFIMFTGVIAAVDKLDLVEVGDLLSDVFTISGRIFFGLVVLFGGVFISNLAVNAVSQSENAPWLKQVVRFATMGIFLAFALHTMGIAENIVELAFGLTLGSIAVTFALAFGLGGREAAGRSMESFLSKFRK